MTYEQMKEAVSAFERLKRIELHLKALLPGTYALLNVGDEEQLFLPHDEARAVLVLLKNRCRRKLLDLGAELPEEWDDA